MKDYILAGIFVVSFFVLIGFAVWYTGSPWCLLALLCAPRVKIKED